MTEQTESEIQAQVVQKLEDAGFFVTITSQDRATRRHVAGLPDLLAFRDNLMLLVECKAPGKRLRDSQKQFRLELTPHLGPNLVYVVISNVSQIEVYE